MSKQVQSLIEKLRKNEEKFVIFMHDLSHALTADELELMRDHAAHVNDDDSSSRTEETTVVSDSNTTQEKLKEAADHLREQADLIESGKIEGLPKELNELVVEIHIKGR